MAFGLQSTLDLANTSFSASVSPTFQSHRNEAARVIPVCQDGLYPSNYEPR